MRAGCQRRFSRNHHPIDQTRGTAPNAVGAPHRGAPPGRPEGKKSRPAVRVCFLSTFLHSSYDILRIRKIWISPESKGSEQNESLDMHWGVTGCSMLTMQNFWQPGGQN